MVLPDRKRRHGLPTGWVLWTGKWYYLTGKAAPMAASSWVLWNDKWYYLTESGAMAASSWVQWNGKWYYLTESGAHGCQQLGTVEWQMVLPDRKRRHGGQYRH